MCELKAAATNAADAMNRVPTEAGKSYGKLKSSFRFSPKFALSNVSWKENAKNENMHIPYTKLQNRF